MADKFRLICNVREAMRKRGLEENGRVQKFVDKECLFLCEPKVPKDTNALIESGNIHTNIGSGRLEYRAPYARRWYYMSASFSEAPERGNYWFERMKQQYKQQILEKAQKIAGENA